MLVECCHVAMEKPIKCEKTKAASNSSSNLVCGFDVCSHVLNEIVIIQYKNVYQSESNQSVHSFLTRTASLESC